MNDSSVRVKVSGDFACFSRPEMKVERVSYEVMTPSAARGILDAILWKPQIRWHILKISVLKPILFHALKRNEVQSKISPKNVSSWIVNPGGYVPQESGAGSGDATPRNTLALRDVEYVIEASPIVYSTSNDDTPRKYIEMFNRRVKKGQCFHRPCFGCREFAADFEPAGDTAQPIDDSRDLGIMLYDIVFRENASKNRSLFFKAQLDRGVLHTDAHRVFDEESIQKEVLACSYKH